MKYVLSILSCSVVALLLFCGTTSCHRDGIVIPTDTASLFLRLHTDIGKNEVDSPGTLYPDTNGRAIALKVAQFYISNIQITATSGKVYTFPGVYMLKTLPDGTFYAGAIPGGSFTYITFDVGVDPTTNTYNPNTYAEPNPLALQNPSMWFGNITYGYVFMNIQGMARDSANQPLVPITYLVGSSELLQTVIMPPHNPAYTVGVRQGLTVEINCDYGKLLRSVPSFSATPTTDTYLTNPTVATNIAMAIPGMFSYTN